MEHYNDKLLDHKLQGMQRVYSYTHNNIPDSIRNSRMYTAHGKNLEGGNFGEFGKWCTIRQILPRQ